MGKIIESVPADIVVVIGGKFVSRTLDLEMPKIIILSSVQQKIEWTFCNNRKSNNKKIIVDTFIWPDKEIVDSSEESAIRIKVLAKKEIQDLVRRCEDQLRHYLESEKWFRRIKFYYQQERLFESVRLPI